MNREEWLSEAGRLFAPLISEAAQKPIPEYYISVGFPKGHRGRGKAIGQCWNGALSEDSKPHIFICPTIKDPTLVIATVIHEIIHTLHPESGHKGEFVFTAARSGLMAPWTATTPSPKLVELINKAIKVLGEYPHAQLTVVKQPKKGSRLRKHVCDRCGTIVYKGSDVFDAMCLEGIEESVSCGGRFVRD